MDSNSRDRAGGGAIVGILAAWTFFELISGGWLRFRFSTGDLDQHVLLGHTLFGFLVLLPALVVIGRAGLSRKTAGARLTSGLLGLGILGAGASGAWLFFVGSSARPTPGRDSHLVTGLSCLCLLLLLALGSRKQPAQRSTERSGLAWLLPLLALAAPFATLGGTVSLWPGESMEIPFPEKYFRRNEPFLGARVQTSHGGAVKIAALANSERCGQCHQAIYKQWLSSSHRQSTISEWYQAQLKLRMETAMASGPAGARFCGACHEPIVTLSGNMDKRGLGPQFPPNRDQGISCTGCHRITGIRDTFGNGSYIYTAHRPYLFENADDPVLASLGRGLLRSKPDAHGKDLMQPFYSSSDVCATCHQVFFKTINGRLYEIQSDYNSWKGSSYSKKGGKTKHQSCQNCHMPLVEAEDPAAIGGKVHSHRFIGANTARPFQTQDHEQLKRTEEFLQQACYLNVQAPAELARGAEARFEVVVTNANVGHTFPGGTTDMVDAWIEAVATDGAGNRLYASGLVDPETLRVDPEAHYYRTYPLDIYGKHLFKRDLWNMFELKEQRLIAPEKSDVALYRFPVPASTQGPIDFRARLRFRRSHQQFTDYSFPDQKMELPITDMASDQARVALIAIEDGEGSASQGGAGN